MNFAGKITAAVALTGALAVASATPSQARWWGGWGWGGPVAAGIGLGLAGAALASAAVAGPYYGGYYGYGYPGYAAYGYDYPGYAYGYGSPGYASYGYDVDYGYGPGGYASYGYGPSYGYAGTTYATRSYAYAPRYRSYGTYATRGGRTYAASRVYRNGRAYGMASGRRAYGMANGGGVTTTNISGVSRRMNTAGPGMAAGRAQAGHGDGIAPLTPREHPTPHVPAAVAAGTGLFAWSCVNSSKPL